VAAEARRQRLDGRLKDKYYELRAAGRNNHFSFGWVIYSDFTGVKLT